jgi:hypothetical protein
MRHWWFFAKMLGSRFNFHAMALSDIPLWP